jgi:peptidylprolyl isomerase
MKAIAAAAIALIATACATTPADTTAQTTATETTTVSTSTSAPTQEETMDTFELPEQLESTPSGLQYKIVREGTGEIPKAGQTVDVHYTGWLTTGGQPFDSSRERGRPFQFRLGAGQVIRGWDEGLAMMKRGEQRILVIPAALGYGARGAGGVIPANATLVFKVELVDFR